MYQNFGTERFIRTILYINAVVAVALGSSLGGLVTIPYLRAVSISVMVVTGLLVALGQSAIFPWICRRPLIWRWLPDIDGEYEVQIKSNWLIVNGRTSTSDVPMEGLLFVKQGTARITARLLSIRMSFKTVDGYSSSHVVVAAIFREQDEPHPVLSYIFKNKVAIPEGSDSGEHFGAARIDIPNTRKIPVLEGSYWTNRNWHKGLNTAGIIRLIRRDGS